MQILKKNIKLQASNKDSAGNNIQNKKLLFLSLWLGLTKHIVGIYLQAWQLRS